MEISAEQVKELRQKTGAGVMDCKKALIEAAGNFEKACSIIAERGLAIAKKKSERTAEQGVIECYVHTGNHLGVMVEVNCETDFVARTPDVSRNWHMTWLCRFRLCARNTYRPMIFRQAPKLIKQAACLLLQPFIKDPGKTIQDIITETVAKTGENIKVRRFVRYELGY